MGESDADRVMTEMGIVFQACTLIYRPGNLFTCRDIKIIYIKEFS